MFTRQFNVMFKKYSNLNKKNISRNNEIFKKRFEKKIYLYIESKDFYRNFKTEK